MAFVDDRGAIVVAGYCGYRSRSLGGDRPLGRARRVVFHRDRIILIREVGISVVIRHGRRSIRAIRRVVWCRVVGHEWGSQMMLWLWMKERWLMR